MKGEYILKIFENSYALYYGKCIYKQIYYMYRAAKEVIQHVNINI